MVLVAHIVAVTRKEVCNVLNFFILQKISVVQMREVDVSNLETPMRH